MYPTPRLLAAALAAALPAFALADDAAGIDCSEPGQGGAPRCALLDPITIIGTPEDAREIAGGATVVTAEELERFEQSDVTRALRRVPGVSLQLEDGYGLRPNISIRGTPTERSSRITLLEDNVLVAPAPYAAPAAYYFPTFGRIHALEVLKGPASITQGPYTIGGALNLVTTPIPADSAGRITLEGGSDSTWRGHGWYGGASERAGWLVETHQWRSDGFQTIDRSGAGTGLDKRDWLAKLRVTSAPDADIYQSLDIKLQTSDEESEQSYLGLTDADFRADPLRRYGLSERDLMDNGHDQVVVTWRIEPSDRLGLYLTYYNNETERAWYKTEGIDFDGSSSPEAFSRTSWASVVRAINLGADLGGLDAEALQAILDGADTPNGSIQLRNNAREYYSRGFQAGADTLFRTGAFDHELQIGLRLHEDQEDRLQRNDTWRQENGRLVLDQRGLEGNAGNRIQDAEAWSFYLWDRISFGDWTVSPGVRYENIEQTRTDFGAGDDLAGRDPEDVARVRSNEEDFWLPGIAASWNAGGGWQLLAGVHRGFSAPGNNDGVEAEESTNYEAGLRYVRGDLFIEAIGFYNDYDNLQGVCTASSGTGCEIGDVFNGDAVTIPGLEFTLTHDLAGEAGFAIPLTVAYTWMNAEFDSDIDDSEFFGDVRAGDPVPYVPDHQLFASVGFVSGPWRAFLSGSYVDAVCTRASCGPFEQTDETTVFDASAHWRLNDRLEFYTVVENLTDEADIVGREPYGARPNKARTWLVGARLDF